MTRDDLAVSEYAQTVFGRSTEDLIKEGRVPKIDLKLEKQVQDTLLKLADEMLLNSAHDCSDGGLAVAIAESCFSSLGRDALGAVIELQTDSLTLEGLLFAETPSRVVVSFSEENMGRVQELIGECPFAVIGKVGNDMLTISIDDEERISYPVAELEAVWEVSLERLLNN
jgi:phosphoribosylformylglycinamidine synthase